MQSQDEMENAIETRSAMLAVSIPEDFSRKLASGETAPIQVLMDGRRSNGAQIAFSYLQGMVEGYMSDRAELAGRQLPSKIVTRYWFNPNLNFVSAQ